MMIKLLLYFHYNIYTFYCIPNAWVNITTVCSKRVNNVTGAVGHSRKKIINLNYLQLKYCISCFIFG